MIATVVREHHWPPTIIGGLFFDSEDHKGLGFWYDDIVEMQKELKAKRGKK